MCNVKNPEFCFSELFGRLPEPSPKPAVREKTVIQRPSDMGKFQFVVLASLRAVQLTRGCTPRVTGIHKRTTMAQLEVAQGKVIEDATPVSPPAVV